MDIQGRVIYVRDYVPTQPKRMNEAFASVFSWFSKKWPCKNKASANFILILS